VHSAIGTEILRWGAARERLRCLRMTALPGLAEGGGEDRPHGSPDSAVLRFRNAKRFPWGKFRALHLGEEEMYSGEFGASRESVAACESVGSLRGLDRIFRLGGTAEAVPFPFMSAGALGGDSRAGGKQQIPRFARNDNLLKC
jgi:hypothetical protein